MDDSQALLPVPSPTSAGQLIRKDDCPAGAERQVLDISHREREMMADWFVAGNTSRPPRTVMNMSRPERSPWDVSPYAQYCKPSYNVNLQTHLEWPRQYQLQMVRPQVSDLLSQWRHIEPTILQSGLSLPRRSERIATRNMSLMAPGLTQWLNDEQILWPRCPDVVKGQADGMAPALNVWLRAQVQSREKCRAQIKTELAAMVPGLMNWLVNEGVLQGRAVQGRVMELSADDGAEQQQAITPGLRCHPS